MAMFIPLSLTLLYDYCSPWDCRQNIDQQAASIRRATLDQRSYQQVLHKDKEEIDEISQVMCHKL